MLVDFIEVKVDASIHVKFVVVNMDGYETDEILCQALECSWIRNLSGLRPWGFLIQKHLIPQCITITYMIKLRGTTAQLALNNSMFLMCMFHGV
jgi:hypothetical protein